MFILLHLISIALSQSVTCPTDAITNGNGVFPQNANNLTYFPADYFCAIKFQIPTGSVVRVEVYTRINSSSDTAFIIDTIGRKKTFKYTSDEFYAPSNYSSFTVKTVSNYSQFFMKYEYKDVSTLTRITAPIATPFALNLTKTSQYTFSSSTNSTLYLSPGSSSDPVNSWDPLTRSVYVFDGPDVTSPFLGYLDEIGGMGVESSGSSMTLVNLYGDLTNSWAMVNEFSAISNFESYSFHVISTTQNLLNRFVSPRITTNVHTIFCEDCDQLYLWQLNLNDISLFNRRVQITPLTPTDNSNVLLTYKSNQENYAAMPQLIPGRMFTVFSESADFSMGVAASIDNWEKALTGRRGAVFSPSLWAPGASPAYSWKFESTIALKFTFNIQSAFIASPGEQISVQVGSAGSAPFTTTFTNSVSNPGVRVANGTYMQVTYTGKDTGSSSIVTFEMEDPNFQTTTMKMDTTTKMGVVNGVIGVLMVVLSRCLTY